MGNLFNFFFVSSQILEHTPEEHADREYLAKALENAQKLCLQVNEGVREQENAERLEWLQSHIMLDGLDEPLVFNSVTKRLGPRKLIHYGPLNKVKFFIVIIICK